MIGRFMGENGSRFVLARRCISRFAALAVYRRKTTAGRSLRVPSREPPPFAFNVNRPEFRGADLNAEVAKVCAEDAEEPSRNRSGSRINMAK